VQRRRGQSENRLEKRLNSQTKFLFMRLWDYFEEEARNSKVSGGEEEQNLKAIPLSPMQLGLVFIPPHRDFRIRARMEYHKKGGFC